MQAAHATSAVFHVRIEGDNEEEVVAQLEPMVAIKDFRMKTRPTALPAPQRAAPSIPTAHMPAASFALNAQGFTHRGGLASGPGERADLRAGALARTSRR